MRDTSRQAIDEITESGRLSELKKQVLAYLRANGPMIAEVLTRQSKIPGAWKMLSILKREKLVIECGKAKSPVTKRTGYIWKATDGSEAPLSGAKTRTVKAWASLDENGYLLRVTGKQGLDTTTPCIVKYTMPEKKSAPQPGLF